MNIGHHRQGLVVHLHGGGAVFGDVAAVSQHHDDGLAHKANLRGREHIGRDVGRQILGGPAQRHAQLVNVARHVRGVYDRLDAGNGQRGRAVYALDQRVGIGAADKGRVQRACGFEIGHVAALALEQPLVFGAQDPLADVTVFSVAHAMLLLGPARPWRP